jgi:hypothetical protein
MAQSGRGSTLRRVGRWCAWAALILLLVTLLSGYGITRFRVVTPLTLGVLNKVVSHRLHHYTTVPLLVCLLVHVGIAVRGRVIASWKRKRRGGIEQ